MAMLPKLIRDVGIIRISALCVPKNFSIMGFYRSSATSDQVSTIPDFGNHRLIFSKHSTSDLCRALFVLQACAIEPLVNNSYKLLRTGEAVLGMRALGVAVRPFYNQFVAGDSEEDLSSVTRSLKQRGVRLMVAPMLESDVGDGSDPQVFGLNVEKMVRFLHMSARHGSVEPGLAKGPVPAICQAKVTGHLRADLLEDVSTQYTGMNHEAKVSAIRWVQSVMCTVEDGQNKSVTDLSAVKCKELLDNSPFSLPEDGLQQIVEGLRRIALYGVLANHLNVVLAVDAEYTYVNPGITLITLALMARHNTHRPLVWNTYQAYLKSTEDWLRVDERLADTLGCCFGAKLVRGAYLEHERNRAANRSLPDPVQDSYEHTNNNYNKLAAKLINESERHLGRRATLVATHNEESVKRALGILTQFPERKDRWCAFAQVYGMAENISIPLASSGAAVYKSVPVGSLTEVLPYLSRRAAENRAVLRGARRERQLLYRELRDRMRGGR